MRNLFLFMMVTLDGFFEGPEHDISWHHTDEEFNDFAIQQTGEVGTLLFGRLTYELMASYWPGEYAREQDPEAVAGLMNNIPKFVFSKTLEKADWQNTTLVKDNAAEAVKKLKEGEGKDVAIFGSSDLTVSLLKAGLVDELRIMVNPVILGKGKRLFEGLDQKLELKLNKTRTFQNGNVLLYYQCLK